MRHVIRTYPSGIDFDIEAPHPRMVCIEDIAHALSRINRFTGHTSGRVGYSVAQHSLIGSFYIDKFELEFLLHDATEAYIGDITTQVKHLIGDRIRDIEDVIAATIWEKFCLDNSDAAHKAVKITDRIMLNTEARDLTTHGILGPCLNSKIIPIEESDRVRQLFLDRFHRLYTERFGVVWLRKSPPNTTSSSPDTPTATFGTTSIWPRAW